MTIFTTENFVVRAFVDGDAADCERFLADRDVMRFIGDGNFRFEKTSALKMIQWFRRTCENSKGLGTWAIMSKTTSEVIGNCHLSEFAPANATEFGIALEKKYWGHGYATEICRALLNYGRKDLALAEIVGTVHAGNEASKRLLGKLGYRFKSSVEHHGITQELHSTI